MTNGRYISVPTDSVYGLLGKTEKGITRGDKLMSPESQTKRARKFNFR